MYTVVHIIQHRVINISNCERCLIIIEDRRGWIAVCVCVRVRARARARACARVCVCVCLCLCL